MLKYFTRRPHHLRWFLGLWVLVLAGAGWGLFHLAWAQPGSLALDTQPAVTRPVYDAFGDLPPVRIVPPRAYRDLRQPDFSALNPGTEGLALNQPQRRDGRVIAILADRTYGREWGIPYLQKAVAELNLLRPELVFTVGDQVEGYTRSGEAYARDVAQYRGIVDQLDMPWYPCAGNHDVISGARDKTDRRFEGLYQRYFGPLWYAVSYNDLHVMVLYSDEQLESNPVLSAAQQAWVQKDLQAIEGNGKTKHVVVLMHKPLWAYKNSGWDDVEKMLVEFNQRNTTAKTGAAVRSVLAGHFHGYARDADRQGIAYYIMGVTGGGIDQDRLAGHLHHYMLLRVDAEGVHPAVVEVGNVLPDTFVMATDRKRLYDLSTISEAQMGIIGTLPQPRGQASGVKTTQESNLKLVLSNPLDVPLDIQVRLAARANLITATQRDNANQYTDNYDSPWVLSTSFASFRLGPKETKEEPLALYCPPQPQDVMPPQVELVIRYTDTQGRTVPVVVKRRVPLVPQMTVTAVKTVTADTWDDAAESNTFAQVASVYDKVEPSPTFKVTADAQRLYVRVEVPDKTFSYWPQFDRAENLPSDAVSLQFAPNTASLPTQVQRIVLLPFAPGGVEVRTNTGQDKQQTPLLLLDTVKHGVTAKVDKSNTGYVLEFSLPRALVLPRGTAAVNLVVTDNDDSGHSTWRSWARDNPGLAAWGMLEIKD